MSLREPEAKPYGCGTESTVTTQTETLKAEAAIGEILTAKPNISTELVNRALDAIADVEDRIQRKLLEDRMAVATRRRLPKPTIVEEVNFRRQQREAQAREEADKRAAV